MILSPLTIIGRTTSSIRSGVADLVEQGEGTARRAAVQRTAQRADGGDDARTEIGAGRGDHARGERRGVEAVVDRRDEVLLDGPGVLAA